MNLDVNSISQISSKLMQLFTLSPLIIIWFNKKNSLIINKMRFHMYLFVDFSPGMYRLWTVPYDFTCWFFTRHVSFVDCPGHDILMATMLNGAAVMDAALLLIGNNTSSVIFYILYLKSIYRLACKKLI